MRMYRGASALGGTEKSSAVGLDTPNDVVFPVSIIEWNPNFPRSRGQCQGPGESKGSPGFCLSGQRRWFGVFVDKPGAFGLYRRNRSQQKTDVLFARQRSCRIGSPFVGIEDLKYRPICAGHMGATCGSIVIFFRHESPFRCFRAASGGFPTGGTVRTVLVVGKEVHPQTVRRSLD